MPPLTPEQLREIPVKLEKLTRNFEDNVLKDISRRIAKAGSVTDTAEWQLIRLKEMGYANDFLEKAIAEYVEKSGEEISRLFFDAAQVSDEFYGSVYAKAGKPFTPLADNPYMQQLIGAGIEQTSGELKNFTQSMGFSLPSPNGKVTFKPIAETYQEVLDLAQMQVSTGVFDYNTAVRNAVKSLTASGIRFVDYASGHVNHADVAVRRAVLTGVSQMTGKISEHNAAELETDLVEVTAHAGARPDHAEWQGRWYSLSGKSKKYPSLVEVTGYGTGAGLKGWNCRHDFYPVPEGISVPAYTEEELRNIDPPPVEYKGETLTYYECTQKQRKMETAIRKTKREIISAKGSSDDEQFTVKSVLLRRQREEYKAFSQKANLLTQTERSQVYGFDRSTAAKSSWAARKKLDNSGRSGIIETGRDKMALEYQRYGRNKDTLVNKTYIDSGEYRRKFDSLTENINVNKTLYDCAKTALKHRSGTEFEDMYWIDSNTGKILLSVTDSTDKRSIVYSDRMKKVIDSFSEAVTLHTHPSSMPPSASDLNSCFSNKYKFGVVACHNGKIFGYTSNEHVSESLYTAYVQRFIKDGNDEYYSQIKALERLSQSFDIKFWEVT